MDVEKAIADMAWMREIHVGYIDWLKQHAQEAARPVERPYVELVGGVEHHEDCCRKYDNVLAILHSLKAAKAA